MHLLCEAAESQIPRLILESSFPSDPRLLVGCRLPQAPRKSIFGTEQKRARALVRPIWSLGRCLRCFAVVVAKVANTEKEQTELVSGHLGNPLKAL